MSYPTLRRAPDRIRFNGDVRRELARFIAHKSEQKQYHIDAWKRSQGHTEPCRVCKCMDDEIQGIKGAIRHFGGRPRV